MAKAQMLFVNKFCSHLKYYDITRDIPDLQKCLYFQYECLSVQVQRLE